MDNKELDEILQKYAESTRSDKDVAFKKLRELPREVKHVPKKFKPRYAFALAICVIVALTLSIALPITLTNTTNNEPTFCEDVDLVYNEVESVSILINDFGINVYYPNFEEESSTIYVITSQVDSTLHGVQISFVLMYDVMVLVNMAIVPKTHILESYENYFSMSEIQYWGQDKVKYSKSYDDVTAMYEMQIYFTDGKYDYFLSANSYGEIAPTDLLDILYS